MNEKEILAYCEAIITEVDIEIMNWHHEIDLMSFIGQEVPLVLYTDEGRHEIGTARLIHDDGALKMTGEITENFAVDTHSHLAYSLGFDLNAGALRAVSLAPKADPYDQSPKAHFTMEADGTVNQYVPLISAGGESPTPNIPWQTSEHLRDRIRDKVYKGRHPQAVQDEFLENHPFFDTKEND